ncbi:MAG TPA: hypothetical protein VIK27_12355 [Candidatus Aquilonibacter sp.]
MDAGSWYNATGWIDRNVYTTTDHITITASVRTGPADAPRLQKTITEVIEETVTTTVDPTSGTATHETISYQEPGMPPAGQSDAPPPAGTQILEESVHIVDQRSTTEISYGSTLAPPSTIATLGEPASTVHTIAIANAGDTSEQLAIDRTAYLAPTTSEPSPAATLDALVNFFSAGSNLGRLLKGPYAPTFVNASA